MTDYAAHLVTDIDYTALAAFAQKHHIVWTREAFTSRTGPDTSPLTLRRESTPWDILPPIGATVKAHGPDGWMYSGTVIEHLGADHYRVRVDRAYQRGAQAE